MPAPTGSGSGNASLLGTAWVAIRGDMSLLDDDLQGVAKNIKGKFSLAGMGAGFLQMGAGFAAAQAPMEAINRVAAEWAQNAHAAVEEANALIEAQVRLKAALQASPTSGLSFEELERQANAIEKLTSVDDAAIMEFQARLVQFGHISGDVFKRATEVAVDWSALYGTSLPEKAMILGRALDNPTRGMQRLVKAGVNLSEQQKKLIEDFQKAGNLAKAQGVILEALESRYGGAAADMVTPIKLLRTELSNAREDLGKLLKDYEAIGTARQTIFTKFQEGTYERIKKDLFELGLDLNKKPSSVGVAGDIAKGAGSTYISAAMQTLGLGNLVQSAQLFNFLRGGWSPDFYLRLQGQENLIGGGAKGTPIKKPSPLDDKDKKERTEGFMDPVMLAKRLQESLLSDQAKMLDIAEQSKDLLERIATGVEDGGASSIGVEN